MLCGIWFGIFDTDMNNNGGSFTYITFSHEDRGYTILLSSINENNQSSSYDEVTNNNYYSLNTWYHVVMAYNNFNGTINTVVTNRDSGNYVTSFSISGGPFASDMDRIGLSDIRTGTYQINGAQAQCFIDNVRFYTN